MNHSLAESEYLTVLKPTFSHNSAQFIGVTSFIVGRLCAAFIYGCVCVQRLHTDATINEVIPPKSFLSAIRRQSVDHSELSQTALTVFKKNYIFAQFCTIQRNYFIYGCVCDQLPPQI